MSTTGVDFKRILEAKYGKTYSGFLSTVKQNDLVKEALNLSITDVYNELAEQITYDHLISIIRTEQVFGLNNNKLFVLPVAISNIDISNVLAPIVTTSTPHNLINGDVVGFANTAGLTTTPALNGSTFTVTVLSTTTFSIVTTAASGTYTASTGAITTVTLAGVNKLVSDYSDLLSLKANYNQKLDLKILEATNTSPVKIKVDKRNNINTGEKIKIAGIAGNTNANGSYYAKVIKSKEFEIYVDKDLTVPVTGNGVSGGNGTIKRVLYKVATPYLSSNKISVYETPTITMPQFERSDSMLKVYPTDVTCEEITIDYIRGDYATIDVSDSSVDLELTYPFDLLIYIANKAARLFFERTKDFESMQASFISEQNTK